MNDRPRGTVMPESMDGIFTIVRNPQEDSKLPYLLRLPIEGGLVLKARDTWPVRPASTATRSRRTGPSRPR
jgi:hypothetical protein